MPSWRQQTRRSSNRECARQPAVQAMFAPWWPERCHCACLLACLVVRLRLDAPYAHHLHAGCRMCYCCACNPTLDADDRPFPTLLPAACPAASVTTVPTASQRSTMCLPCWHLWGGRTRQTAAAGAWRKWSGARGRQRSTGKDAAAMISAQVAAHHHRCCWPAEMVLLQ